MDSLISSIQPFYILTGKVTISNMQFAASLLNWPEVHLVYNFSNGCDLNQFRVLPLLVKTQSIAANILEQYAYTHKLKRFSPEVCGPSDAKYSKLYFNMHGTFMDALTTIIPFDIEVLLGNLSRTAV